MLSTKVKIKLSLLFFPDLISEFISQFHLYTISLFVTKTFNSLKLLFKEFILCFLADRAEDNLFCFSHSSEQEEKIMFLIFSSLGFEPATLN